MVVVVLGLAVAVATAMAMADIEAVTGDDYEEMKEEWVGEQVGEDEEEMMMTMEETMEMRRRRLAQSRYIGYDALKADSVPCGRRGRSYYDCNRRGRANPYTRGCSAITRCARRTD